MERDLIYLSAALDAIGRKARHGLHFRINRSRFYAAEFESLLGTLKIGNIDTWVAYDQFVTRGLKPAFGSYWPYPAPPPGRLRNAGLLVVRTLILLDLLAPASGLTAPTADQFPTE